MFGHADPVAVVAARRPSSKQSKLSFATADACFHRLPAEDLLRNPVDDQDPDYLKLKSLIDGRRARSYVPQVMHFSSLVARGRATSTDAGLTEALGILGHGGLPRDCARVILEFYQW